MSFDKNKIAELYPGAEDMMFEPMLIHSSTDKKLKEICSSDDYFGQLKKDGSLYLYTKTSKESYLFGRTVSKKTGLLTEKSANVPHIMEALDTSLPPNTIILGEIYYPGKGRSSNDVTAIMGCLPEKAVARQEHGSWGRIHYFIYDILMYDGIDFILAETPNLLRYKILRHLFDRCGLKIYYEYLELAKIFEDNLYEKIGNALAIGEEGMVIKKKDGIYEPGKRPMTNYKAKKVDYIDAVIIGFESPTKEYNGKELDSWVYNIDKTTEERLEGTYVQLREKGLDILPVTKPWYCGWNNSRIRIGAFDDENNLIPIGIIHSGISDNMKMDMSKYPKKFLNKVCSIQCMELDPIEKTLRHGFFRQIRTDKNPEECLLKNIFDL